MKYVPNLIPENVKVLPDYFKGNTYEPTSKNILITIFSYFGAIILFLLAVASVKNPLLVFLLGFSGFILLPDGHQLLEKTLRFRLTTRIKSVLFATIFLASIPLTIQYVGVLKKEAEQEKVQQAKVDQERLEANKKEQQRKDSLNYYVQSSNELSKSNKVDNALKDLDKASLFATGKNDSDRISKERVEISSIKVLALVKAGKYNKAIPLLTSLILLESNNADLLYNRGICYNKTGKIQEAVDDFRTATDLGNTNAETLFDKINPIRKKVIGYLTLCCDGSTSSSSGRGACSHHGGVCGNKAIYERSRRYGAKNDSEQNSFNSSY